MKTTITMKKKGTVEARILTENFVAVEGRDCVVHRWSGYLVRGGDNAKNEWKDYALELEKIPLNWKGTTQEEIFGGKDIPEGIIPKIHEASKRAREIVAEKNKAKMEKQAQDKAENKNGWITLEMIPGKNCQGRVTYYIKAKQVTEHFCINSISGDYDASRDKTITHIPTGLRIAACLKVPEAKRLAKELETLPIDWDKTSFTKEEQGLVASTREKYQSI